MSEILSIANINKRFTDNHVLRNVSFSVSSGEVIVVVGPSGCGKSTLLRCIIGLDPIESGHISVDGQVIGQDISAAQARQKIGMVFQSYDLFPHLNVMKNLILAPMKVQKRDREECIKAATALLERVGLSDKANAFPRQLSGGQKQRVAIVRALMMNPEIMLFDEVTAALDPEMVREVLDCLLELARAGMTMIIVTHEMPFAKAVANKVIFMDNGEIIETADPQSFFTNPRSERAAAFLDIFRFEK
jgi:polar amino acid transport system ATP-binding protein